MFVLGVVSPAEESSSLCKGIALIASSGTDFWHSFEGSVYCRDGLPHPLDRWTRSVLVPLSRTIGGTYIHPNDQPFRPFQAWALATGQVFRSPLNLLIHPRYGLWWALRGAYLLGDEKLIQELKVLSQVGFEQESPCDDCAKKSCLSACPVNAFSSEGLNVSLCWNYINHHSGTQCALGKCAARNICPVGQEWAYSSAQQIFHMNSFSKA